MDTITTAFQIIVSLGIINVWLFRAKKFTAYRGHESKTLQEEFTAYGLSSRVFYIVGFLKITSAVALLLGFLIPMLVPIAATIVALLMVGALAMHFKIKDAASKSLPASLMLAMSLWLVLA
jgi:hypothetical protein